MDLKNTIIKQLSAPVKRKGTQEYMTDEDGNIVTSEAAIGMTVDIIDTALADLAPLKKLT